MSDAIVVEGKQKSMMVKPNRNRNDERIEEGERELQELEEAQRKQAEEAEAAEKDAQEDEHLSAEEKSFKKRYGDLRRHSQKKEKELSDRIEALEKQLSQPTNKGTIEAPKGDEDLEAWSKKYPDVAKVVEKLARKIASEELSRTKQKFEDLETFAQETKLSRAEAEILRAHPDFEDLRDSDAFHDWAESKPKWVQDALYENADDADAVIGVLDFYKAENRKKPGPKPKAEREAAKDAVSRRERTTPKDDSGEYLYSESQVNRMSAREYEEHEEEIMKAIKSGQFLYDMSAAR